jgi:hypothetical protein
MGKTVSEAPRSTLETPGFLNCESELAWLIRDFDWGSTRLGPIGGWPQTLKTIVALILNSPLPMVLQWGADGHMIYNDAYSVFAGGRHPQLLGSAVRQGWTKPLGEGTGLGLSMVYGFARQSGGQARIYSEEGDGAAMPAAEPMEIEPARHGETVLVVDDEQTVRMLITDMLGELGYVAIEAGDGKAGTHMLTKPFAMDTLANRITGILAAP